MPVPIIGERQDPYIVVGMVPGAAPGTFDIQLDTQHFPGGTPLAAQCLMQAVMFLMPRVFQDIAEMAVQQLLQQQRAQANGSSDLWH